MQTKVKWWENDWKHAWAPNAIPPPHPSSTQQTLYTGKDDKEEKCCLMECECRNLLVRQPNIYKRWFCTMWAYILRIYLRTHTFGKYTNKSLMFSYLVAIYSHCIYKQGSMFLSLSARYIMFTMEFCETDRYISISYNILGSFIIVSVCVPWNWYVCVCSRPMLWYFF